MTDDFLSASRAALPFHYPDVFGGLTHSQGRCICGWRGRRRWGIGRAATIEACDDYHDHLRAHTGRQP